MSVPANNKWLISLIPILCWIAAAYFWIFPLFRPEGIYGWGHYRLVDVYLGVPILFAAICATVALVGSASARRRQRVFRLASLFASTLLTIAVLDAVYVIGFQKALRTPTPTDFWFYGNSISADDNIPDNELGFRRKPNIFWQGRLSPDGKDLTYRTDENGFRNEFGIRQADIAFIGDSFTEGASVSQEDTFVRQLGRKLNRIVVNLGCGYYGAQQELMVLRRYGLAYNPHVVVWQLFEGNDLGDARRFADWQKNPVRKESLVQRYTRYSLITRWLARTIPTGTAVPRKLQHKDGTTGPVYLDYSYLPDEPAQEPLGFAETKKAIEAGYRLCESRGIKLVILFVPIKVRVLGSQVIFNDEKDRDQFLPHGVTDSERDFAHEMAKFCKQLGCPFIDPTDALRSHAAEDNRFVYMTSQDSHLDVDGHKVVSEALAKWMQANSK